MLPVPNLIPDELLVSGWANVIALSVWSVLIFAGYGLTVKQREPDRTLIPFGISVFLLTLVYVVGMLELISDTDRMYLIRDCIFMIAITGSIRVAFGSVYYGNVVWSQLANLGRRVRRRVSEVGHGRAAS